MQQRVPKALRPLSACLGLALGLVLAPSASAQIIQYYHLDAVGSIRAVTDQSGAVVEQHAYLPFGEEWCGNQVCGSTAPGSEPKRFTGKERDGETGLDYFGARYYRSNIARFTTVDPTMAIRANLIDPQGWNRYAYGHNNPLRNVDFNGQWDGSTLRADYRMAVASGAQVPSSSSLDLVFAAPMGIIGGVGLVGVAVEVGPALLATAVTTAALPSTQRAVVEGLEGLAGGPPISPSVAPETYVVRGGVATAERIGKTIGPHREVPGLVGFSAQSRAGATVEELAAHGGVGGGPFPNNKISVSTQEELCSIGCTITPSPGGGANHVTVTPGTATPAEISAKFTVRPNPAKQQP